MRSALWRLLPGPLARRIICVNFLSLLVIAASFLAAQSLQVARLSKADHLLQAEASAIANILESAEAGLQSAAPSALARHLVPGVTMTILGADGAIITRIGPGMTKASGIGPFPVPRRRTGARMRPSAFAAPAQATTRLNSAATPVSDRAHGLSGGLWLDARASILRDGAIAGEIVLRRDVSQLMAQQPMLRATFLTGIGLALLICVGASLLLARSLTRPLADLAQAADPDIAGVAQTRFPDLTARSDEIGQVSRAMLGMMAALSDRVDVNARFAADVAHEIKNPLASLRSAAGGLRVTDKPEHVHCLIDVIETDVCRLDRLVSDISAAARLDAELCGDPLASFDLTALLVSLCGHLSRGAGDNGVDLIHVLPEDPIHVTGLEGRIAQVFVNIITNATSFCGPGGTVRVWSDCRADRALVVVEDTGPGIPDAALDKIFTRFYSERPAHQFGDHSGLGLAISRQIVEAHQGIIWAENIRADGAAPHSPPQGARFIVALPL